MAAFDPKVDNLKYEIEDDSPQRAKIKVLGVGGGGSNAVAHMLASGLEGLEFYVLNTDAQALGASPVPNKLAIGARVTHGRGAGGDPEVGRQAALEDTERIVEILEGSDIVFVAAGLGSGTGTGGAPVVASLAREMNALTIAIVTKPFAFEGARRKKQAEKGVTELAASVDAVLTIPNERLLALAPRGTSLVEGFRMSNDLLRQIVQDIMEIITTPGLINRDLADIRATLLGQGYAVMGTATAKGENAALEAARQAIGSPLLEDSGITGARNLLINITGSSRLGLHDVDEACALLRKAAGSEDVQVNFGVVLNEKMEDAVKITVIATGFPRETAPEATAPKPAVTEDFWSRPVVEPEVASEPEIEPEPLPVEATPGPEPELVLETAAPASPSAILDDPEDDLDTPAFLRRRVLH